MRALVTLLALAWPALAAADFIPQADRPVIQPEGTGVLSLDFSIGLNRGAAGKTLGLGTALAGDPYSGLSVSYGAYRGLEVGASGAYTYRHNDVLGVYPRRPNWPRLAGTDERTLGPFHVYARFRAMSVIGLELGLLVPGDHIGNDRLALQFSAPFRVTVIPGVLAVHGRPELLFGFTKSGWAADTPIQSSFYLALGVTANALPELYLDLSLGYGRALHPSAATLNGGNPGGLPEQGFLPVSVRLGYAVIPALELFCGFSMNNLLPVEGTGPMDGRALTIGMDLHF